MSLSVTDAGSRLCTVVRFKAA